MERETLVQVRHLTVRYPLGGGREVHALTDVSLDIRAGEVLALVGESGCGKSTFGQALLRLREPTAGEIFFRGRPITALSQREFAPYRRRMQPVFQDPYASLDPRMNVREILAEPLRTHRLCATREQMTARVTELLESVGLSAEYLRRYPHQLSGGQRQRIGIARALALQPEFLLCDEPVSALDVSVQNQILNLLCDLRERFSLTVLLISHDLAVVRFLADRVCVMFLGSLCEIGQTEELYRRPLHPYTRFLLDAAPKTDPSAPREDRLLLSGELPSAIHPPAGCRFHTRCPYATQRCRSVVPELREVAGRMVACHRCEELF